MLDDPQRQRPLVDEADGPAVDAERGPERGSGFIRGCVVGGVRLLERSARRVQDRAGHLRRRPLECLGGTNHRRGGVREIPRELAEESAAAQVGATVDRTWWRRLHDVAAARHRSIGVARFGGVGRLESGDRIGQ